MARIRSIKPEFPESESMGRVSRDARLLFLQLWTICDDEGRTRADSRFLARTLYPYDDGKNGSPETSSTDVDGWLAELDREGCVVRYTVGGSTYLQVCNWLIHQKIDKPSASRLPAFSEDSRITREDSRKLAPDLDLGPRTKEGIKSTLSADEQPTPGEPDQPSRFAEFWAAYPRHEQKAKAQGVWKSKRLDRIADQIIADVNRRKAEHRPWAEGFIPHPQRYLADQRWTDAIDTTKPRPPHDHDHRSGSRRESVAERASRLAREGDEREAAREAQGLGDAPALGANVRDLRPPLDVGFRRIG